MSVQQFLKPEMERLYREEPDLTTAEIATRLHDYLTQTPGTQRSYADELMDMALRQLWGSYYSTVRRGTRKRAKRAVVTNSFAGGIAEFMVLEFRQSRLPLPEGVRPLEECGVLELRRSVEYMRQQQRGIGSTISQTLALAEQLEGASLRAGNPDLTVGEADNQGLLNWTAVAAA